MVLVTRFDYRFGHTPARGDIVECRFSGRSGVYVKRVIGLPGDEVIYPDGAATSTAQRFPSPTRPARLRITALCSGKTNIWFWAIIAAKAYDSRAEDMGFLSADCFPRPRALRALAVQMD